MKGLDRGDRRRSADAGPKTLLFEGFMWGSDYFFSFKAQVWDGAVETGRGGQRLLMEEAG